VHAGPHEPRAALPRRLKAGPDGGPVDPADRGAPQGRTLKELRLLDAAHIVGDVEEIGEPTVSNGLSLCAIHHRAFDENLVGVSPDYVVHVSPRLREDEDGPMLDLLKGFHEAPLYVPSRAADRPDRGRLDIRFVRFLEFA
jgi:putative restriction endonuclease